MIEHREAQQLERLTFFSDAVFAIAMTLLVIEVRLPHVTELSDHAIGQALANLLPNYVGFVVSFLVLARFWAAHHVVMGYLDRANGRIVWTNLLLLMSVAFMPFPTAVVSEYAQTRVAICFYAGWLLAIGLLNRRLIVLAADPSLRADDTHVADVRLYRRRSLIPIIIAVGAFLSGLVSPIAGLVVLVVGSPVVTLVVGRLAARADRA